MENPDPVYKKEDGTWWHVDEIWADEHGPFPDETSAREALSKYIDYVNNGPSQ